MRSPGRNQWFTPKSSARAPIRLSGRLLERPGYSAGRGPFNESLERADELSARNVGGTHLLMFTFSTFRASRVSEVSVANRFERTSPGCVRGRVRTGTKSDTDLTLPCPTANLIATPETKNPPLAAGFGGCGTRIRT